MKKEITYRKVGEVYLPNLVSVSTNYEIGAWGRKHEAYLKECEKSHYTTLLTTGKLNSYLHDVDIRATEMYEALISQLAEKQGVTEQLKADDMMAWVGAMNNIASQAREIVYNELIYS